MAALSLVPDPAVLTVQAGIFLVNYVVIKKLMVEPYVKMRAMRDKQTRGSQDDAGKYLTEAEAIQGRLVQRLSHAANEAKQAREQVRAAALENRQSIVAAAEVDSRKHVAAVEQEVQRELAQEQAKVPGIVKSLTDEVYQVALA